MARRIANTAAQRARSQHGLAHSGVAKRSRGEIRTAADGETGWIGEGGKRAVGFDAEHYAARRHVVVAELNTVERTIAFGESIRGSVEAEGNPDRCATGNRGRPFASRGQSHMAANIEACPVVVER